MNKQRQEYLSNRKKRLDYISQLGKTIQKHPEYENCRIAVDALMDFDYYESGTILLISPSREGFNDLYEYSDLYRGGFEEIKVGNNYVIYGFEFD